MSVDLEALEKFYAHHGWIHDEPWKELLSELRELRAERDALNESADALIDRWDGLVAERDGLKGRPGEIQSLRDDIAKLLNSETRLLARVAELTRLGNAMASELADFDTLSSAEEAWRKAVRHE